jgi:hypothetical protein
MFLRSSKILAVWLLLAALAGGVRAAETAVPGRWLLVFDATGPMKKLLPATVAELQQLFATAADGQLQNGDNVAVWMLSEQVDGRFPTFVWRGPDTPTLTNLFTFLERQTFRANGSLAMLQPSLNRVMTASPQLTVVLFTAGTSALTGTPYDAGVNQSFLDARDERRKSGQPFVVLLRSEAGKYIGCTVNYLPGDLNYPPFTPPAPVPPVKPPVVAAPVKPAPVVVPDLVIVGRQVGTNLNAPAAPTAPVAPTNVAIASPPITATNPPPSNAVKAVVANPKIITSNLPAVAVAKPEPVSAPTVVTNPPVLTNAVVAAPAETPKAGGNFPVGWLLLALAGGGGALLLARLFRRPQSSLITSSLDDDERRK